MRVFNIIFSVVFAHALQKTFCYDGENVGTTVKEVTKLLSRTRRTLVYPKASDLLVSTHGNILKTRDVVENCI